MPPGGENCCELTYFNSDGPIDEADCWEALMLAQLQLALNSCNCQTVKADNEVGGVAGGGYLLGLIAFARKFAGVILSLSLLCGILLLSFYLGSIYGSGDVEVDLTLSTSLAATPNPGQQTAGITSDSPGVGIPALTGCQSLV